MATIASRRAAFLGLATTVAAGLAALGWRAVAPGGVDALEAAVLACLALNLPWASLSVGNAVVGLLLRLLAEDPVRAVLPAFRRAPPAPQTRTAVAVCVKDEDPEPMLGLLGRLLADLEARGCGPLFTAFVLSDTQDVVRAGQEEDAVRRFRQRGGAAARLRYRRRASNEGFKAGNVMEFLDHHVEDHELVLVLDADSEMTAEAVLRLVGCFEADAELAIVQHLVVGRPTAAPFPRLFQFGMRAGMRTWATGQAAWQGPHGPYWGHNAIVRVAPFREHARLETLPSGTTLLSHDQVEAALLHSAGWKVMCLPEEDGSLEGNPPALPEFLARDRRWAAGNMQYLRLLLDPRFSRMARWQLLQAVLLFAGTPAYALACVFALASALGPGEPAPRGPLVVAGVALVAALSASKLAGYLEVLLVPRLAARHGGRARFLGGVGAELLFSALLAPISILNRAAAVLGRRDARWGAQNREARGVSFATATRHLGAHTLLGFAVLVAIGIRAPSALPLALPFVAGLVLAVPFCVVTASPRLARALVRTRIAATPEETQIGRT